MAEAKKVPRRQDAGLKNMANLDEVMAYPFQSAPIPSEPLVSIIVTNYNYADFLEDTILSVLQQDYPNLELLVMDGGSTDGSLEILKKYSSDPRMRFVSEPDDGHMPAVNRGIGMAKGQVIGMLHTTDTYCQGIVSAAVEHFLVHEDSAFWGADVRIMDAHGFTRNVLDNKSIGADSISVEQACEFERYPPAITSFFRADLLKFVGGFFDSCHTNTYLLYFLVAHFNGYSLHRDPRILGNYRWHLHDVYEDWSLYKSIFYSYQRQWICDQLLRGFQGHLLPRQSKILASIGHFDELKRRHRQQRQILGALPTLFTFLARGGRWSWVAQEYVEIASLLVKKVFRVLFGLKVKQIHPDEDCTVDTRWYLSEEKRKHRPEWAASAYSQSLSK